MRRMTSALRECRPLSIVITMKTLMLIAHGDALMLQHNWNRMAMSLLTINKTVMAPWKKMVENTSHTLKKINCGVMLCSSPGVCLSLFTTILPVFLRRFTCSGLHSPAPCWCSGSQQGGHGFNFDPGLSVRSSTLCLCPRGYSLGNMAPDTCSPHAIVNCLDCSGVKANCNKFAIIAVCRPA